MNERRFLRTGRKAVQGTRYASSPCSSPFLKHFCFANRGSAVKAPQQRRGTETRSYSQHWEFALSSSPHVNLAGPVSFDKTALLTAQQLKHFFWVTEHVQIFIRLEHSGLSLNNFKHFKILTKSKNFSKSQNFSKFFWKWQN